MMVFNIVIFTVFLSACMAETQFSGSQIGYALESFGGYTYPAQFVQTLDSCMANEVCLDVAIAAYPIPDDEDLDAATEEAIMPEQDDGHGRRLAGLPDRYNWANSDTHRCANEGGWCACDGNVVYTKKCQGTFSCNQANWGEVVSNRWNSNHKSDVNGGVWCNNGNFGGDPFSGHDKQCFCHPRQTSPSQYDYVQKWTRQKCYNTCGRPGANWWSNDFWKGVWCGFSCTGHCPIRAGAFVAGREQIFGKEYGVVFPIEDCAEFCYCVFKGWTG